jgi:hypothetical protein
MAPVEQPRVRARARINRPLVLAAIVAGASIEDVAKDLKLSVKRVENLLRRELQRRWVAPAQEHARLQIARLEAIAVKLKPKTDEGDLPSIDRLLRLLDRLDRYHGYSKLTAIADAKQDEDVRGKLAVKIGTPALAPPGGEA